MGAQQAAFAAGSAFGPVMAGAIFQASGSYTPVVLITAAGLLTSALILRGGRSNPTTDRDRNRRELLRAKPGHRII
jgi:cyanate permease